MPGSAAQEALARGALDWLDGAAPAAPPEWIAASEPLARWLLEVRPYLSARQTYRDGVPGLPLDAVLSLGDHGVSIVHQVIDALRQEARRGSLNRVPWREVLRLPGAALFADFAVAGGSLKGKTPLCLLANQRMPGPEHHAACGSIFAWLLAQRASPDLPQCREKSPLMLAAGSGHADMVELLLAARASVEWPAGPGLDAVLACASKLKGEEINIVRVFSCLEKHGYQVPPRPVAGTASRRGQSQPATWGPGDIHGSSSTAAARTPPQPVAAPAAAAPAAAVAAPAAAASAPAGSPEAASAPAKGPPPPPPEPTILEQQEQFQRQQVRDMERLLAWAREPAQQVLPSQVLPKAMSALDMLQEQHQAHVRRMLPPGQQQLARESLMADLISAEVERQRQQRAAAAGGIAGDAGPVPPLRPLLPKAPPLLYYDDNLSPPPPHPPRPHTAAVANPAIAPAVASAVADPTVAAPAVGIGSAANPPPPPPQAVGIGAAANLPPPPPHRVPAVTPAVADPAAVAAPAVAAPAAPKPRGFKAGPPHILAAAEVARAAAAAAEELARQQDLQQQLLADAAANPPPAATTVGPAAAAVHPTQGDGNWNSSGPAAPPAQGGGSRRSDGGWSFDWGDLDELPASAAQPTQGGGWNSSRSGGGWPGAAWDATRSSNEARPNTGLWLAAEWGAGQGQADEGAWSWRWSRGAWVYSPQRLSPQGRWAWTDDGRHAIYFLPPRW